jgi:hypothetical protein
MWLEVAPLNPQVWIDAVLPSTRTNKVATQAVDAIRAALNTLRGVVTHPGTTVSWATEILIKTLGLAECYIRDELAAAKTG